MLSGILKYRYALVGFIGIVGVLASGMQGFGGFRLRGQCCC